MFIPGLFIILIGFAVFGWVNASSRTAAQRTAQTATGAIEQTIGSMVSQMEPLVDVMVASWVEARRWKRQLEELGHQPFVDHTLTTNARRSAQRFHDLAHHGTVPSTTRSVSEILEHLMPDEIRPVAHLVGAVQFAPPISVPPIRNVSPTRVTSVPQAAPATTAAKKREKHTAATAHEIDVDVDDVQDSATQELLARLGSRDVAVKTAAAIELREIDNDSATVRALLAALNAQVFVSEGDFDFAHEALKTLESSLRYGDEVSDDLKVATVSLCSRLLEMLLPPVGDDDDAPHENLYMKLCDVFEIDGLVDYVEPALPMFRRLLRNQPGHPHANWLMLTLGKIGGAEDGALLVELLDHPNNSIMSNAAWALEEMKFSGAGPALRRILVSGRSLAWGRAMNALVALHDPETIARMSEHLDAKEALDMGRFLEAVEKHSLKEIASLLVRKAVDSNWVKQKAGTWRDPEHLSADFLRVAASFGETNALGYLRQMADAGAVSPLARSLAAVTLMKLGETKYVAVVADCIPRCWDPRRGGMSPLAKVLYMLNEIHLLRRIPAEHADAVAGLIARGQEDKLLWRSPR